LIHFPGILKSFPGLHSITLGTEGFIPGLVASLRI